MARLARHVQTATRAPVASRPGWHSCDLTARDQENFVGPAEDVQESGWFIEVDGANADTAVGEVLDLGDVAADEGDVLGGGDPGSLANSALPPPVC